jgi:hypothetical protein
VAAAAFNALQRVASEQDANGDKADRLAGGRR